MAAVTTDPIEFEADGQKFRAVLLDGETGRTLALDVLRMFGPAVASIASSPDGGAGEVMGAAAMMKPDDLTRIINVLGAVTQAQTEPGSDKWRHMNEGFRKDFFRGRQKLQAMWLWEALKVQLADFFGSRANG